MEENAKHEIHNCTLKSVSFCLMGSQNMIHNLPEILERQGHISSFRTIGKVPYAFSLRTEKKGQNKLTKVLDMIIFVVGHTYNSPRTLQMYTTLHVPTYMSTYL